MPSKAKEGTDDESSHCSHDEKENEDDGDDVALTNSTGDDPSWNEKAGVIPVMVMRIQSQKILLEPRMLVGGR